MLCHERILDTITIRYIGELDYEGSWAEWQDKGSDGWDSPNPHGAKTDGDHLIKDNLGCYWLASFYLFMCCFEGVKHKWSRLHLSSGHSHYLSFDQGGVPSIRLSPATGISVFDPSQSNTRQLTCTGTGECWFVSAHSPLKVLCACLLQCVHVRVHSSHPLYVPPHTLTQSTVPRACQPLSSSSLFLIQGLIEPKLVSAIV